MEDTLQVTTIEIDGQEYFLVDYVREENNTYDFFANTNNIEDIQIMKEKIKDGEKFYVSIDNNVEFDKAFNLYYNKLKNQA